MSYEDRFFQKVKKTDTCWFWVGALNSKGYGSLSVDRKAIGAHRFSYSTFVGLIPKKMFVCHTCDTPSCVNPKHLFTGTNSDNMRDMIAKNRQGQSQRRQTHCRKGHKFIKSNTYVRSRPDGKQERLCRKCKQASAKKRKNDPVEREKRRNYQREYQRKHYYKNKKRACSSVVRAGDS